MSSKTVPIDLETGNLLWLKGRALVAGRRSVSDLVNDLVSQARTGNRAAGDDRGSGSSIKGTIEISENDPGLEEADAEVRALFLASADRFPPE